LQKFVSEKSIGQLTKKYCSFYTEEYGRYLYGIISFQKEKEERGRNSPCCVYSTSSVGNRKAILSARFLS
jgi:hypothetical protein